MSSNFQLWYFIHVEQRLSTTGVFRFVAKETTSLLLSNPIQLGGPPLVKIRRATALVNHDAILAEV